MRSTRSRCVPPLALSATFLALGLAGCAPPVQLGGVAIAPGLLERMRLASRFGHDELEARAEGPPPTEAASVPEETPRAPPASEPESDAIASESAAIASESAAIASDPAATEASSPADVPPSPGGCMPPANDDPRAHGDGDRGGRAGPR